MIRLFSFINFQSNIFLLNSLWFMANNQQAIFLLAFYKIKKHLNKKLLLFYSKKIILTEEFFIVYHYFE